MTRAPPPSRPPEQSVVIAFRFCGDDGPVGIVIGPGHAPYYLLPDGSVAFVAAEWAAPDVEASE